MPGNFFDQRSIHRRKLFRPLRRINGLDFVHIVEQQRLVTRSNRDDMVDGQIAQHTRLDLNLFRVYLPFHLVACLKFFTAHHPRQGKHLHTLATCVHAEDFGHTRFAVQSSLLGFLPPLLAVSVALEADRF